MHRAEARARFLKRTFQKASEACCANPIFTRKMKRDKHLHRAEGRAGFLECSYPKSLQGMLRGAQIKMKILTFETK